MDIDIDLSSHKRDKVFEVLQRYFNSIGGEIVRVATFGTETARSAISTACRGLGISSDVGRHLSSLIPIERGKVRDLKTCYYGDQEETPITEFVNICNQYQHLKLIETAIEIEGLVNKCSIHAAGIIITNTDFTDHNAIMVAPNGTLITAWSLGESEYTGGIKYDALNTKTMSMIQTCVEMLIEAGHMEWQGSLRATYDKYLLPENIDMTNPELWRILNEGKALSAFQFDSPQGRLGLNAVKPASLLEVAATNTLIRLMVEDGEQPLDRYVRYRNNINEWYQDMKDYGLNEEEMEIMKEYLSHDYGVMNTQEMLMLVSQSQKISNFDVPESNKLRKSIAKKNQKLYEEVRELFYKKGLANGCRKVFLDYIWDEQVALSRGYGFSILHSVSYSMILCQQLQLIHKYPSIYWACAVLQVESGSLDQETLEEDEGEEHETKEKTTNYGALATAISMLQQSGIAIQPPHINKAQIGFTPYESEDGKGGSIIYGLKGVSKLNNETAQLIMDHRPYTSFNDFVERLVETKQIVVSESGKQQSKSLVSKGQLISLIKAGAFDELEAGVSREELMERYLRSQFKPRTTVNDKFIQEVMALGMIDPRFEQELKHHHFRAYLKTLPKYQDESVKAIKWHTINTGDPAQDDYTTNYFFTHFADEMEEGRDYQFNDHGQLEIALGTKRKGSFEEVVSRFIKPLQEWLKSDDCLARYNEMAYLDFKDKYAAGTKEAWEMEALSVYLDQHEVEVIDHQAHGFVSFNDLPEEPEIVGYNNYKGRQTPKFKLSRIVGCVVDKDKNKHTLSLLTPQGCVTVKFHAGNFAHYDKVISVVDPATGTKTKLENSWLKKGTLLALTGFRQGDNFKPRTYADSIVKHSVQRLTFDRQQRLHIQGERTHI